ncbi:hypothetical protein LIQ07_18610 [Blautia luti]|nr:hypothetical protein [Blautia luti]
MFVSADIAMDRRYQAQAFHSKWNFPGETAYKKCMIRGDGRRRNERE